MTYDVVFINSHPVENTKVRGLGPHLLANELRRHGYTAMVLDYIEHWTLDEFDTAMKKFVGKNTRLIGFSLTWAYAGLGSETKVGLGLYYDKDVSGNTLIGNYLVNGNMNRMLSMVPRFNDTEPPKVMVGGSKARTIEKMFDERVDHIMAGYSETQIIDVMEGKELPRIIDHDTKAHCEHTGYDFAVAKTKWAKETFLSSDEIVPIECSRGCRFKCKFCNFPLIGMKHVAAYTKTKETFRDELLRNYENFGITKYSIQDDTFNDRIEKVRLFAEVVDSLPFDIKFWCYLRADMLVTQPEQKELLHQMGLCATWFGIETYCRKAGQVVGKGTDPEKIKEMLYDVREMWKGDVFIQQGYIVGLPHETKKDVAESVEWLSKDSCPVDSTLMIPLFIAPKEVQKQYHINYLSEFDRTYQMYGYEFPDAHKAPETPVERAAEISMWTKNDDTDINSFQEAYMLTQKYQPILDKKKPIYPVEDFYESARQNFTNLRETYITPLLNL